MRLDTSFYNAFRNTVRILLNKHEYARERGEIEALIASRKSYLTKLQTIAGALKKLCSGSVVFADFETGAMSAVREAHACVSKSEAQCTSSPFCVSTGETCQLAIPKRSSTSVHFNFPSSHSMEFIESLKGSESSFSNCRIFSVQLEPGIRKNETLLCQL